MPRAIVHDTLGLGSGAGTTVTSGGTNAKGSWVSLGTPTAGWSEFDLFLISSTGTTRFIVDLSLGASNDIVVQNLYAFPNGNQAFRVRLPVGLPGGVEVWARCQASSGTPTLAMFLLGCKAFPDAPISHKRCEAINIDLTTTRPAAGNVPLDNSWVELVSSLSRDYRGFLVNAADNATNPATAQTGSVAIGSGASGVEAELGRGLIRILTGASGLPNFPFLVESPLAAGQRLLARAQAATTGDNLRVPVMGLY